MGMKTVRGVYAIEEESTSAQQRVDLKKSGWDNLTVHDVSGIRVRLGMSLRRHHTKITIIYRYHQVTLHIIYPLIHHLSAHHLEDVAQILPTALIVRELENENVCTHEGGSNAQSVPIHA
ncbi:hypothetical protein FQR65_LT19685 [Abscondita terminalis]|nr:hypothetical protein FQR65_LT19685 [Abscondita terminalis]